LDVVTDAASDQMDAGETQSSQNFFSQTTRKSDQKKTNLARNLKYLEKVIRKLYKKIKI